MTHSDQAVCARADPAGLPDVAPAPIAEAVPGPRLSLRKVLTGLGGVVLAVGLGWGAWVGLTPWFHRPDDRLQHLPTMTVAKVDLTSELNAWGRVESSHNTIITCETERLEIRAGGGRTMSSGGSSIILTLIDEGTQVKKGDVLCTLDSSEYEELVRTQEIKTEQAAAAQKQAQLSYEVAVLAVKEYAEGLAKQQLQSMEGTLALARSEQERAADRLAWTEKMLGKGYASVATKAGAAQDVNLSRHDLMTSGLDRANFLEYGRKKTQMELTAEVEKRRFEVLANDMRVTRNRDQLAYYRKMVERCTIRAPHDGFLIYAYDQTKPNSNAIEPGQTVRQGQKLFYLPDLEKMEVLAYIHESTAKQVHEGMRARARIEGLANRSLEGHVVSVGPLPTNAGNWFSDEVKYFVAVVKLDSVPIGMKPGMTAEVVVEVDRRFDILAVPTEAVAVEAGHNICYVAGTEGLERRPVTLGRSNRDLLEVTRGLAEGDHVVLRPDKLGLGDSIAAQRAGEATFDEAQAGDPPAAPGGPVTVD